jgi:anti-anti-sigma regulatory factor
LKSITLERNATHAVLRMAGDCSMTTAAELKALLIEGLGAAGRLCVDLGDVEEIDVTVLQLLWAAHGEAARENRELVSRVPDALAALARAAGFEKFPGESQEAGKESPEAARG